MVGALFGLCVVDFGVCLVAAWCFGLCGFVICWWVSSCGFAGFGWFDVLFVI